MSNLRKRSIHIL